MMRCRARCGQQMSAEHVDGLIDSVVCVRNRPGEVGWAGDLHRSKIGRLPAMSLAG